MAPCKTFLLSHLTGQRLSRRLNLIFKFIRWQTVKLHCQLNSSKQYLCTLRMFFSLLFLLTESISWTLRMTRRWVFVMCTTILKWLTCSHLMQLNNFKQYFLMILHWLRSLLVPALMESILSLSHIKIKISITGKLSKLSMHRICLQMPSLIHPIRNILLQAVQIRQSKYGNPIWAVLVRWRFSKDIRKLF